MMDTSPVSLRRAVLWRGSNLIVGVSQEGIASPPSMAARNDTIGYSIKYRLKDH